jgi:phosphatidylglycerophosphatase A
MKFKISKVISTLFYLGFYSKMPGTLGSAVGLLSGVLVLMYFNYEFFLIFFVMITIIGLFSVYKYQKIVGKSDKSEIIIDEFIGQLIPLMIIEIKVLDLFLSFALFRFFDILKFYPANVIDRKYSNYFGVIFDDIIAGIQASLVILLYYFLYDKL